MEYFTAKKVRDEWGNKPCDHPKIEKEYFADTHTIDYVCSQCGKEFTILEMFETKANLKRSRKDKTLLSAL